MLPILTKYAIKGRVETVELPPDSKVWAFCNALRSKKSAINLPNLYWRPVLALDPGETTGLAIWDPSRSQILLAQLRTPTIPEAVDILNPLIAYLATDSPPLGHVRYEDYRIYGYMTEQHTGINLHTAQMLGSIQTICHQQNIRSSPALAAHAKKFWTDEKLKLCGVYCKGLKHARDAQRHLLRYMGETR